VLAVLAGVPARAVTATGLSSFEAIEEPLVKFYPATAQFEPDTFINITDVGGGAFRFFARYNATWWDGDRDTTNRDRQRMEVKGLGPHQRDGDTFEYAFTWRSNAGFRGSSGFCHLFQLKATNGDSGAPLITLSIRGDKAIVEANPDGPKITAREFAWRPDTWQSVRLRVKTSPKADGELLVSIDGDAFRGKTGVALSRPQSTEYRPKWGLYRRAAANGPMGDDFIEHRAISAQQIGGPIVDNAPLETDARRRATAGSPGKALEWLGAQPASAARDFALASIAARWAESDPAAAMAWVEERKDKMLRHDATLRVFSRWADRDVTAAAKWLHAHAPSPELDELVWLFTTDTTYRYVQRPIAVDALPLIKDPELRAQAFAHVVEIWSRSERDAALAFVERTPALSAQQKHALLAELRARPAAK
jgi:hypothetical protein